MPNLANALSLPQNGGVIISRRMWQREFGNSVSVVGQRIQINNIKLPITGIAPDRLEGLYRDQIVDLWTPLPTQTPGRDPRNRTHHCYRDSGSHRQRFSLQEGPRIFCMAGSGTWRALHRRQAKAHRYQQTRKQISAQALRARSARRPPAEDQAKHQLEYMAS